jgi:hypothetical protein
MLNFLEQITQTMNYIDNYTDTSIHRTYCTFTFCKVNFGSSFYPSNGGGTQIINNQYGTDICESKLRSILVLAQKPKALNYATI